MDKELVSYQLLLAGLKKKAEEGEQSQRVADILNEWADQLEVGITFFFQDGKIIWTLN